MPDVVARFLPGAGRYQVCFLCSESIYNFIPSIVFSVQILFTDYTNFAILWSCSSIANIGYTGIEFKLMMIITR